MDQRVFCISLTERMLEEAYTIGLLPFAVDTDQVLVPNPAKDPVWIAKMANWIAMLVLWEAYIKRRNSVVRVGDDGIYIHEKDDDGERLFRDDKLTRPMKHYIAQIHASYNPYEMNDTDYVTLFLNEVRNEIFNFMKQNWEYCPEQIGGIFEFSWGKE
jgi:hypothetical protein